MTLVVGVLGFKGSGKDTIGDYLVDQHGYERDSFANPLKDAVSAVFGWPRNLLEGDTKSSREWREMPDAWWEEKLDWENHPGSKSAKDLRQELHSNGLAQKSFGLVSTIVFGSIH